jgi:hypothetical protein
MKTTHFEDDDTLVIGLCRKPVVRGVRRDRGMHLSHAADGTVVETVIVRPGQRGSWPRSAASNGPTVDQ